ncbi:unnamed protein product, partial [Mesorhabditis belari]|uniref:Uncharacterized protein n=1 Tax=Mesorhabditis belari TaxID=2138241 RepID=A0AAF3EU94_9BILA
MKHFILIRSSLHVSFQLYYGATGKPEKPYGSDQQHLRAQFHVVFPIYHFTQKAWAKVMKRALVEMEKKFWTNDDEEEDDDSVSSSSSISIKVGNVVIDTLSNEKHPKAKQASSNLPQIDNEARLARLEEELDKVANEVLHILQLLGYETSERKLR